MKIVHIQSGTPSSGGSTYRLHRKLIENGIDSKILSLTSNRKSKEIFIPKDIFKNLKVVLNNKLTKFLTRNQKEGTGLYSFPVFGIDVSDNIHVKKADIILIYWAIGGFLNFKSYESLLKLNKPVVIFLRDMWGITGGCHHSFDCDKYQIDCTNCPIFLESNIKGLAYRQLRLKKKLFSKYKNVSFASPSKWLQECAKNSVVSKNKKVLHLPNIIDTDIFKPFKKNIARKILNINSDKKIISFGAKGGAKSPYKGWSYLEKALFILKEKYPKTQFQVLIFGSENDKELVDSIPYDTIFTGYLYDDYALSIVYNAIDVFITPSIADNLPSTVLECQSCGTPVVGFNIGGIPDMISHKKNGYLSIYKDSYDLAKGIIYCLEELDTVSLNAELLPENVIKMYETEINNILN